MAKTMPTRSNANLSPNIVFDFLYFVFQMDGSHSLCLHRLLQGLELVIIRTQHLKYRETERKSERIEIEGKKEKRMEIGGENRNYDRKSENKQKERKKNEKEWNGLPVWIWVCLFACQSRCWRLHFSVPSRPSSASRHRCPSGGTPPPMQTDSPPHEPEDAKKKNNNNKRKETKEFKGKRRLEEGGEKKSMMRREKKGKQVRREGGCGEKGVTRNRWRRPWCGQSRRETNRSDRENTKKGKEKNTRKRKYCEERRKMLLRRE